MTGGQKILPKLEINDTVEYQGNMYIVRHIAYNYLSKAQMTLSVKNYEAPPLAEESKTEEETETPKEETKPDEVDLFENPEKLKELHSDAETHFIEMAKLAKEYMEQKGLEFIPIKINSAWRSRENQRGILAYKLDKYKKDDGTWTENMYEYYKSSSLSASYLKIIQNFYDGVYKDILAGKIVAPDSDYDAIENAYNASRYADRNGAERKRLFKKIIEENPIGIGSSTNATTVLTKSMVIEHSIFYKGNPNKFWNEPLFNPSFHVIGDENNKASIALDLATTPSAEAMYDMHLSKGKSGYPGNAHYHLTYF